MSPSIIWLVSSLPVSGFSLTNQEFNGFKQLLIPWITRLLFFLSTPLSSCSVCLGSPPLQVHLVVSTHWLRLYGNVSSPLFQEKREPPSGAASTLTYRPHIGGPTAVPKTAFPVSLPDVYSTHTGILAVPQNLHSHLPGVKKCSPRYLHSVFPNSSDCSNISCRRSCLWPLYQRSFFPSTF